MSSSSDSQPIDPTSQSSSALSPNPSNASDVAANQKAVAAGIAIMAISSVTLFFFYLACLALSGAIIDATTDHLLLGWSIFVWILELGTTFGIIYGGLLTVVSTGLTYVGTLYTSKRALIVLIGIALLGILFCSIVMFQMDRGENTYEPISHTLSAMAKTVQYQSPPAFEAAADKLIISIIGWLSAFVLAQLGISKFVPGGALK